MEEINLFDQNTYTSIVDKKERLLELVQNREDITMKRMWKNIQKLEKSKRQILRIAYLVNQQERNHLIGRIGFPTFRENGEICSEGSAFLIGHDLRAMGQKKGLLYEITKEHIKMSFREFFPIKIWDLTLGTFEYNDRKNQIVEATINSKDKLFDKIESFYD